MNKQVQFIVMLMISVLTITVEAQSTYSDFTLGDEGWVAAE